MTAGIVSLCSGYGGLDLAVEAVLDARTTHVADIDRDACTVLAHRFPDAPNLGDLRAVDWERVKTGRRGNPQLAQAMYDRYCQGLSIAQVAEEFGRTRQSVWKMLSRRGWDLRPRPPARQSVSHQGRTYSLGDGGYYRATDGDRAYLHRVVWEQSHGLIPSGWDVHHKDHDKLNNDPGNLQAMPRDEHARLHGAQEVTPDEYPAVILTAGYP